MPLTIDTSNRTFQEAADHVLQSGESLFLTGRAGTGKTTFLKYIMEATTKRHAVVAPTGIAALNAGGMTVHSMFGIPPRPFSPEAPPEVIARNVKLFGWKRKILEKIELLIIDEVSMVRADLLDTMDHVLRNQRKAPGAATKPFGGAQVLMIGDPYQLPPVVRTDERLDLLFHYGSPFFFDAHSFKALAPRTIELEHIYRQKDDRFKELLNAIRGGDIGPGVQELLGTRVKPDLASAPPEGYITLSSHRRTADAINKRELAALSGKTTSYEGAIKGKFNEKDAPAPMLLELKVGAQVMFVKNDSEGRFKNGSLGTVTRLFKDEVEVELHDPPPSHKNDPEISVKAAQWDKIKYAANEQTGKLEEQSEGSFKQIPLTLAWAVTIHKSQGLTLEKVVADVAACFDSGQTYVALSRCTTLEGLVLPAMPTARAITVAPEVQAFMAATTAGTEA